MQKRKSAAQWSEMVSAWETSKLTAGDVFASEHGVPASSLRWWKTELARRARKEPRRRPAKGAVVGQRRAASPSRASCDREEKSAPSGVRGGVAVLAGGARIVVEHGFDGRLLRELVRALEEAR